MTQNKIAVITGASSGIGKAIAEQMAAHGYDLHLVARREYLLEEIKKDLEGKYQITVNYETHDLAKPEEYKQLAKNLEKVKIDYFFNNAGTSYFGNVAEQDAQRTDELVSLLINSVTYLTNTVTKQMAANGGGTIVNTGSIVAYFPYAPCHAVYSAAKKYVFDLSRAVNYENQKLNNKVRVVALNPGMIKTDLQQNAMPKKGMTYHPPGKAQDPNDFAKEAIRRIMSGKDVVTYGPMAFSSKTLWMMPKKAAAGICYKTMQKFMGMNK